MSKSLLSIGKVLKANGHLVLVCGKAGIEIGGKKKQIRTSDLCLLAANKVNKDKEYFKVKAIYRDKILLKQGSYFAVHSGKKYHSNGKISKRYGEDEILILQSVKKY